MNTVSFPLLGLEFEINRVAFQIGGLKVYWYGIIIAVGFALAVFYAFKNAKKFGVVADKVIDVAIGGIIGGIIGARAYFVIFSWDTFKDDIWGIFRVWEGGIAIYGGLIGGAIAGAIVCRLYKVKFIAMLDVAVVGFLIGQGIGRWGNFVNVEAYGAPMETLMPWGMTSAKIVRELGVEAGTLVHPCFLYESLWCLLGVLVLHLFSKHRRFDGEMALFYCVWYGAERFLVEGLRTDSLYIGSFRVSQVLALILCVGAAITWIIIRVMIHKKADPSYLLPLGKQTVEVTTETVEIATEENNDGEDN